MEIYTDTFGLVPLFSWEVGLITEIAGRKIELQSQVSANSMSA